jgi:hypothetical protein
MGGGSGGNDWEGGRGERVCWGTEVHVSLLEYYPFGCGYSVTVDTLTNTLDTLTSNLDTHTHASNHEAPGRIRWWWVGEGEEEDVGERDEEESENMNPKRHGTDTGHGTDHGPVEAVPLDWVDELEEGSDFVSFREDQDSVGTAQGSWGEESQKTHLSARLDLCDMSGFADDREGDQGEGWRGEGHRERMGSVVRQWEDRVEISVHTDGCVPPIPWWEGKVWHVCYGVHSSAPCEVTNLPWGTGAGGEFLKSHVLSRRTLPLRCFCHRGGGGGGHQHHQKPSTPPPPSTQPTPPPPSTPLPPLPAHTPLPKLQPVEPASSSFPLPLPPPSPPPSPPSQPPPLPPPPPGKISENS